MEESSPEALIQAYSSLIGKPYMPPYWSLGFQLSRYGYNSLAKLKAAVDRTIEAKIPYDVQYADIDHFRKQLDFTYDTVNFNGLPEYIKELRTKGVRFIIILDPAINMEEQNYTTHLNGLANDIYIKWPNDQNPQFNETSDNQNPYMVGYVWPEGKTVFPDFFKQKTHEWWMKEIDNHYKNTLTFDGLWIDMNEPANFDTNKPKPWNWPPNRPEWNLKCPHNDYDDPPYVPLIATHYGKDTRISDKTLCMRGIQGDNNEFIHYDVHNLYGWSQTEPTLKALRNTLNKRSIVITRSTYPSSGTNSGHWLGDNTSIWAHLKQNIIGLLEFNLFGIPYIGADICGFFGDATPEMCTRWMQIGAFNTFYRNHNGYNGIDQDPLALGKDVADTSRKITEIRYSLLPTLYTLFYLVSQNGGTVIRSVMHEFPSDPRAMDIDRQFMWGSSLLISPVLDKNVRSVYAYFPKTRWFDFYTGKEVETTGRVHEIDAPLDHLPLHVRGGSILVTQESAVNTDLSRKNPFGLIIAPLKLDQKVKGGLYWDEGDVIDASGNSTLINFEFTPGSNRHILKVSAQEINFALLESNYLKTIRIFGVTSQIDNVTVNGVVHTKYEHDPRTYQLTIFDLRIKLDSVDSKEIIVNLK
ncbi:unnamed protein product [Brachionus calyciflorus]|uniref:Uncharacterized protein n=1 Tax=Brachionus calyciflorus TaxID=104777 RepID=A0A814KYY2_9BILA|nr:unnamed protein product [Brachionus calyciflorus]